MTKNEEIKLEELKFVKQQEHFVDQKLNIISVISGIFISGAFVFISTKFELITLNEKIWFFVFIGIAILFLFLAVSPQVFFKFKKKDKENENQKDKKKMNLNSLPPQHNLYKKAGYQGWEINFESSLEAQINLSRQFLKTKTFFCRTLIIVEFSMFLGIGILFIFYL